MSKFIDKLNNLNKSAIPAMGFRRAGSEEKLACMLVVVEIAGKSEDEIRELAVAGIAAVLIDPAGLSAAALSKLIKSSSELTTGMVLTNGKAGNSQKAASGDIDFLIYDPGITIKAFEDKDMENTGKIIRLGQEMDAGLLRSVNNLYPGVDAVMVDLTALPITLESMMGCRRVADFSGQHIIARMAGIPSKAELLSLREAGVKCLLLKAETTATEARDLVEAISALPRPDKKKERKGIALVPSVGIGFGAKKEDENGGDDDDD